ncbi:dihydrofolate reductase [Halomicroarcula sp. F13]|uniref:dihydrofolate reductase n=1 Tax=Haloarcula rubra TaxID=2487747 RepID=A0AAW4PTI3_9EURY|nr:dihydrofolate reductase [Halomicroarcula rubra]MBX0324439.1 dihydrofolate reductase [Halomicroarcula rubra]
MRIALVAAVAANGVIGSEGGIPWHYPTDLQHFKETTVGHPVIMGRRTFDTIYRELGTPLPDRRNIVLTHRPESLPDGVVPVDSTAAALRAAETDDVSTTYVVGGGAVYEQFLPRADELILTEIHEAVDGDTAFPAVEWDHWHETDRERHEAFDIVWYARSGEPPDE